MALVPVIDRTTYNKAIACPPQWDQGRWYYFGWHPRRDYIPMPSRIVVHTTNGARDSKFENECRFLMTSKLVGAHYLVAKDGRVVRLLNPKEGCAWHAGAVKAGWDNNRSIGIEMHFTPGEEVRWEQIKTCGNLILDLCAVYPTIGDLQTSMDLHRRVAVPAGRKVDASNMSNEFFDMWRMELQRRRKLLGI